MSIKTTTHINFRGNAKEALEFYQSVFDGDLSVITYEDAHNVQDESDAKQVMWGQVTSKNGFQVMAYDVPSKTPWEQGTIPFFVSVRGDSNDEITKYWENLSEGATVLQPLAPSGWTPLYGMLKDRFGVTWVLDIAVEYKG